MGWEQRGNRRYYYRKKREGKRVRSNYEGHGWHGWLCASNDADRRRERAAHREANRQTREVERQIDRQLLEVEQELAALTGGTLICAGYRKHKGQWRKKRYETQKVADQGA